MTVCHHKKKVNNFCSFLVLSFTTRDEVEIDLLKPGPCAVSARKSQALPAPWGGVSGAGRISKTDLLSQGKETLVSFSFLSSHREHSSLFPPQRQMPWGWVVWSDTGRGGCSSVPSRWHIPPSEVRVESSHLWHGPTTHSDSPYRWGARCMQDFEARVAFMWINSTHI